MATKKPRIQVTILREKNYKTILEWAEYENMSQSQVINYIIERYFDKSNELSDEENLIVKAYRYGSEEEKKLLWNAFLKADEMRFERQKK